MKPRKVQTRGKFKELIAPVFDLRGKFKLNWARPYVIKTLFSGGAAKLMDMDGEEIFQPVNLDRLRKYYV